MKAVFVCIFLAIMLISMTSIGSAETEDYIELLNLFSSIDNTHDDLGNTEKLQKMNSVKRGPGGDMVTLRGNCFTIYMIVQGWPAVICEPNSDPNIIGSQCYIKDGVDLSNTLIYHAGVKDVADRSAASLEILKTTISENKTLGTITLLMDVEVDWARIIKSKNEDGSTTSYMISGTWKGSLSQTIPTPKVFNYSKTENIIYEHSGFNKVAKTSLAETRYGFTIKGYVPSYSISDTIKSILLQEVEPENESVNIALSFYKKYYEIVWDEKRQIYYGKLIEVSNLPKIEVTGAQMLYDYSNKSVSSIQMDNNTVLTEFSIMTPFGRKNVKMNVTNTVRTDFIKNSIEPISILLTFVLLFYAIQRLIFKGR